MLAVITSSYGPLRPTTEEPHEGQIVPTTICPMFFVSDLLALLRFLRYANFTDREASNHQGGVRPRSWYD